MLHDEQFMERTPDLVAKIRKLREAAEKEMNQFTRVADYDVRRVVGQKPKASPASGEMPSPVTVGERTKKQAVKPPTAQSAMAFPASIAQHKDDGEVHP